LAERYELGPNRSQGLVDILDRILDKGLVIAGDIRVRLADVELLTIQIRLLVCSIDKAEEIGMNWWRTDPYFAAPEVGAPEIRQISDKLDRLEQRLMALEPSRKNPK
jgi:ubiquinone biosynthesis protein UbiJ